MWTPTTRRRWGAVAPCGCVRDGGSIYQKTGEWDLAFRCVLRWSDYLASRADYAEASDVLYKDANLDVRGCDPVAPCDAGAEE